MQKKLVDQKKNDQGPETSRRQVDKLYCWRGNKIKQKDMVDVIRNTSYSANELIKASFLNI